MISTLITVLILALVFSLIWYAIGLMPLPAPFGNIVRIIAIIIFILILLSMIGLIPGASSPLFIR